tara:strand:+ start:12895 stop:15537 length:2643 start_codon:yes stop_codon:yes gene_type:complete
MRIGDKGENEKKSRLFFPVICLSFLILGILLGIKNVPGYLKANFIVLCNPDLLASLFEGRNIDILYLDIKLENLKKIEKVREFAIKQGRLITSDEDFVNAKISFRGLLSPCKVRLKGDLPDHWNNDKWSMRVEMKDDSTLKGMSRFSLQKPRIRNNTGEWMFLKTLRKEGCMSVRYDYVEVVMNGKSKGMFAMEEHFSKEMIEHNQRREGLIFKFDDDMFWKKFPSDIASYIDKNLIFRSSVPIFRNNKRIENNAMLAQQKEIVSKLIRSSQDNSLGASKVFSAEKTGKFLAQVKIWNTEHCLSIDDINFYYNPVTCLIEPIGFDGCPGNSELGAFFNTSINSNEDNWVNFCLKDHSIMSSYINYLYKFSSSEYLSEIQRNFEDQEIKFRRHLLRDLVFESPAEIWSNHSTLLDYDPWQILQKRANRIRKELSERKIIKTFAELNLEKNLIVIKVRNTTTQPVEVRDVKLNSHKWRTSDLDSVPRRNSSSTHENTIIDHFGTGLKQIKGDLIFKLPLDSNIKTMLLNKNILLLEVRFLGNPEGFFDVKVPLSTYNYRINNLPSLASASAQDHNSSLIKKKNLSWTIQSGTHCIKESLIIPSRIRLTIQPGTVLIFDEKSVFISKSQIIAKGTENEPIVFTSSNKGWPGFLLTETKSNSYFEHVLFENMLGIGQEHNINGVEKGGWSMTGGITVNESPSHFTSCKFDNSLSEDALNIISTSFSLQNCFFQDSFSDAFDGDFVKGKVIDCVFRNIKGDGIDLSGSEVEIVNCDLELIKDKGISVGENSKVSVQNSRINKVSFGIVSKDLSQTIVSDSIIIKASKAGFSAYKKKNSFGAASIQISKSSVIDSNRNFLVQNGSSIKNNNNWIKTVDVDIVELYD